MNKKSSPSGMGSNIAQEDFGVTELIRMLRKQLEELQVREKTLLAVMWEVRELCDLICNSPNTTTIKNAIESKAYFLGHHPFVLKAKNPEDQS